MGKYDHPERRPAVITGASSGIGAETAWTLARAGLPVALGARRVDRLEELVTKIRAEGHEAVAHPLDVADDSSVAEFAAKVEADLGPVQVVVSNAALIEPGRLTEFEADDFLRQVQVNLLGPQRLVHTFLPGMVERGQGGDIVFISSDVAVRARPFMSGYTATKRGLEGLAEALRMELEGTGVRASVVRPGPTHSEAGSDWSAEHTELVINEWIKWGHARHPRTLKASAIANAIHMIVTAPRGTHITPVDVTPEAPIKDPK